jgi:hypothetical protein
MSNYNKSFKSAFISLTAAIAIFPVLSVAQQDMAPVNDLPNP